MQCDNIGQAYGIDTETNMDGTYTLTGLSFGSYKVSSPANGRWGENDGELGAGMVQSENQLGSG